jgi:Ca-activated chloride channel family protein
MIHTPYPVRSMKPQRVFASMLLAAVFFAPALAQSQSIRFVSPRHLSTAIGPSNIELLVYPPRGLTADRVVLYVDGQQLTVLDGPPWRASWDAGDGSRGHRIEAVLHLSDGRTERQAVRTSALHINQVEEVGLVNLYPVVRLGDGTYVADLERGDFRILENGVEQKIDRFTTERRPLRIGIVLDSSLTMEGRKLRNAKKAALEFLDILEDEDQGMVVTFSDDVQVLQEVTAERSALAKAIEAVQARGGTALYDAVWRTAKRLGGLDGRRVLVLLSDGRDEASNGFEPGSLHTLEEALNQALRSEVMVFAIGLGRNLDTDLDFHRRYTLKEILHRMGNVTGGRALITPGSGKLRKAFDEVAEDLRHQYSIAYKSTDETKDGAWRTIQVQTPGRELEITCREGYFASLPEVRESGL